jgi:MoaA/NifB/PqqE/SkfB family radical SAM enzyme
MNSKPYSELKIFKHTEKLDDLSKGIISSPIYIRIKPTNKCNHSCFYCSYKPGVKNILSENINLNDSIPLEKMDEILSDLKDMDVKAVTYSGGGEPLIYPHITKALVDTLDYGIDLSIITNGQNLKGVNAELLSRAKWVRISLDSASSSTFKKIRHVKKSFFYELLNNIEKFSNMKNSNCEFGINFVVNHLNAEEVFDSAKLYRDLGVNHIKFTPRWIEGDWLGYHSPFMKSVLHQIETARSELETSNFSVYDTYDNDLNMTGVKERKYKKCYIMQITPVIAADSNVYFCHDKTYTNKGLLGSIKDKSFKQLWFSEESKKIFNGMDPSIWCKHHCTYDFRNILIDNFIKLNEVHNNFI